MKISVLLIYLSFICCLFLGKNIIIAIGYPNTFLGKYLPNPAIYFLFIAFVLSSCRYFFKFKEESKLFIWLLVAVIATMLMNGSKFPKDSFFPSIMLPALLSITLSVIGQKINKRFLVKIFYVYYILECGLAIIEKIQGYVFFPEISFETGFNLANEGFRSFSLRGHPLANGSMVSLMICFIIVSCKSRLQKNGLVVLGLVSLMCFNTRFALIVTTFVYIIFIIRDFSEAKINYKLFYCIFIALFYSMAISLFAKGWGDRLIDNGLNDDSAAARLVALQILTDNSIFDFLKGYNASTIESITGSMDGIGAAIENCWIIFILQYGIVFLSLGIFYYIPVFRKQGRNYSKYEFNLIIVPWLLITSSSNSIAVGGLSICTLFLLMFAFDEETHHIRINNFNYESTI